MQRRLSITLAAVALSLIAPGCKAKVKGSDIGKVTLAEAETFGKDLVKRLQTNCNYSSLKQVIDLEHVAVAAAHEVGAGRSFVDGFLKGGSRSFFENICNAILPTTKVTMLRAREVDGTMRVVVRLVFDEGFDYHEHSVGKLKGKVRSYDIFYYQAAQQLSTLMKEIVGAFAKDKPGQARMARMQNAIDRVNSLELEGRAAEARAALASLPAELRETKALLLRDLTLAGQVNDDEYAKAIAAYEKKYPGDPSLDMVLIDGYILRKQWDKSLAAIDGLDKQLGGDAYLDIIRANVNVSAERVDEAEALYKKALATEDLIDGHWGLADVARLRKDHKRLAEMLTALRGKGETVDNAAIATADEFKDFAASPEGKAFLGTAPESAK